MGASHPVHYQEAEWPHTAAYLTFSFVNNPESTAQSMIIPPLEDFLSLKNVIKIISQMQVQWFLSQVILRSVKMTTGTNKSSE